MIDSPAGMSDMILGQNGKSLATSNNPAYKDDIGGQNREGAGKAG